jgi:Tfp pilus assembly protein FimT
MDSSFAPAVRRSQLGRSLIETLVSIALGTLMLVLSTTSVLALVMHESGNGTARALASSLDLARGEAARLRRTVVVCGLAPHSAQAPAGEVACDEAGNPWRAGWVVFEDGNRNSRLDDGENVLQVSRRANANVQSVAASSASLEPNGPIAFRPFGTLARPVPAALHVDAAGEPAQSICVRVDGHVRLAALGASCGTGY